jgi:hypothetical protein
VAFFVLRKLVEWERAGEHRAAEVAAARTIAALAEALR